MASTTRQLRRFTPGGIPYAQLSGPEITVRPGTTTATESRLINASSITAFYNEAIPPPIIFLDVIIQPDGLELPGQPPLIAKQVTFTPFVSDLPGDPFSQDTAATAGTYTDLYEAKINYEASTKNTQDENDPETFLEQSMSAGIQFLVITPEGATTEDGEPIAEKNVPLTKAIPTVEWSMKWSFALNPNFGTIFSMIGKVNAAPTNLFPNAGAEQVLFAGMSGSRQAVWDGDVGFIRPWNLEMKFAQRTVNDGGETYGWNHIWLAKQGRWDRVKKKDGTPMHETGDLASVFTI